MIDYRLATIMLAALLSARPLLSFAKSPNDFPCAAHHIFPDPIDIRDNQHAPAVMRRHPELKSLPGYLDESIEDDSPKVFSAETCVVWNSRTVPNGSHQISLKAYDEQDLEIPFGDADLRVFVAN